MRFENELFNFYAIIAIVVCGIILVLTTSHKD